MAFSPEEQISLSLATSAGLVTIVSANSKGKTRLVSEAVAGILATSSLAVFIYAESKNEVSSTSSLTRKKYYPGWR